MRRLANLFLLISLFLPVVNASYAGSTNHPFDWIVENSETAIIGEVVEYSSRINQDYYRVFVKAESYIIERPTKSTKVIHCYLFGDDGPPVEGETYLIFLKSSHGGGYEIMEGGKGMFPISASSDPLVDRALRLTGETSFHPLPSSPMHSLDMYWPPILVLAFLGVSAIYSYSQTDLDL